MDTAHPALDETDDEYVEDDSAGEDGERDGQTRRWGRFVMPVMVEIGCEDDEITSVVTLPSEIRLDRDDAMELCIYDEAFHRQPADEQPQVHALYLAGPEWEASRHRGGSPVNWPPAASWHDDYFPRHADDDAYAEVHPYGDGDQDH